MTSSKCTGALGYLFANSEREFISKVEGQPNLAGSAKGDSQEPVFGAGFGWNINVMYTIRAEYQKISDVGSSNTGTEDMDNIVPGPDRSFLDHRVKHGILVNVFCVLLAGACPGCMNAAPQAAPVGDAFSSTPVAEFREPWAMTFLPDGRLLVSEKKGALKLLDVASGRQGEIAGVPTVAYGGQGGFGDVILHPAFGTNHLVYVSYSEPGDDDTSGAAVARARLAFDAQGGGRLEDLAVIWRQVPKVDSDGHWGHRLAFGPDGKLWITSSERQQFTPAQDMKSNLGKIVRLNEDGSVPADNPFFAQGGVTAQIWSLGHRNLLGLAFDTQGRLYAHEMGPRGGDELNLIEKGANYGYPVVSNGDHYGGARDSRSSHASRVQGAAHQLDAGDLARRLHHLLRHDVSAVDWRRLHRRTVVAVTGAREVHQR